MIKILGTTISVLLLLIACGEKNVTMSKDFKIYVFDPRNISHIDETRESIWEMLQTVPLTTSLYTITEDLLLEYDWENQTLSFTNEWAAKGEDPPLFMRDAIFLVVFDDQRLFGGRMVSGRSPQPFDYPAFVMRPASDKNPPPGLSYNRVLVYSFHPKATAGYPSQSIFPAYDPAMAEPVRDYLESIGKLK